MRLLIDSNALIWMVAEPAVLTIEARRALEDLGNDRFVSIASLWEIAVKMSRGKLALPGTLEAAVEGMAAAVLPITFAHVDRVGCLPFHHRDPFDRMLIAQAMVEGLTIVTRDRHFPAYGVPLLMA